MGVFVLSFVISACFFGILLSIKIDNAGKNQIKILKAIDNYADESEDYDKALILIRNMEDLRGTIFRLTDWGYKNILPKEDFELIEPYIQ